MTDKNTLDSKDFFDYETPTSSICLNCIHLHGFNEMYSCDAFKKIPLKIWKGENNHTKPYPGDNGIMFEKIEK